MHRNRLHGAGLVASRDGVYSSDGIELPLKVRFTVTMLLLIYGDLVLSLDKNKKVNISLLFIAATHHIGVEKIKIKLK